LVLSVKSYSTSDLGKAKLASKVNAKDSDSDYSDDLACALSKKPVTPVDKAIMNIRNKRIHGPTQVKGNNYDILHLDSDSDDDELNKEEVEAKGKTCLIN
jgi:hypothetical protein